ncbi:MAG: hypothetical protein K6E76_00940 [Patescibacteria group bacterium]|nr:hypothetical protein [Patescibacteria group bacterium]
MFFAVIGNNFELCQKELEFLHPSRVEQIDDHLILFDTEEKGEISQIASLVKRGEVLPFKEIEKKLYDQEGGMKRILGIDDFNLGLGFKKKYKMKRFKPVELLHTDLDVKKKGIELVQLGKER